MEVSFRFISLVPCMAVLLAAPLAHAQITGIVYQGIPDASNAGDAANMAGTLANASFTVGAGGIDFLSPPAAYTTSAFLNNPTFTSPANGFNANGTVDNNEVVLTGTLFLNAGNNSFLVGHDDGVVLNIAGFGTVVNAPGPTSFSTSPFTVDNTGAAGNFNFTLDYAECCGPPADLEFQVNNSTIGGTTTPEPSSFVLFGSGLLAAVGMVRRRLAL
jgi:PEP-CTERM motif